MNAFVVLHVLRHTLHCRLPVIVAHFGSEEFSNATKAFFMEHIPDLEFLNIGGTPKEWPPHHVYLDSYGSEPRDVGYKIKVWSLYKAPFREVLFLDADSTPILDPAMLFDIAPFEQHGSIFWPDFWRDPVSLYRALAIIPDPWVNAGAVDPPADVNKLTISIAGFNAKPPSSVNPSLIRLNGDAHLGNSDDKDGHQDTSLGDIGSQKKSDGSSFSESEKTLKASKGQAGNERSIANRSPQPGGSTADEEGEALFRMQWPYQAESGQIYLNRTKHWLALEYALFLNTHDSLTYKHSMGDKDTFRAAFALAGAHEDYWQCPFPPSLPLHDRGAAYDEVGFAVFPFERDVFWSSSFSLNTYCLTSK
jgi:hypothetical protein